MKRIVMLAVVFVLAACATGYQQSGFTGGFEEMQLGDRSYQVRFSGNAYTSASRASKFVMRRAAELTLEKGYRYFKLSERNNEATVGGSMGVVNTWPSESAIVTFVDDPEGALDAVIIVRETDAEAGGALSPQAKVALEKYQAPSS